MTDERKRSSFGFWAAVMVLVVLLYPLSFGPACWIASYLGSRSEPFLETVYQPFMRLWWREAGPRLPMNNDLLVRYASLGCTNPPPSGITWVFYLQNGRYHARHVPDAFFSN